MLLCDYPPGPAQLGIYDRSSCEVTFGYWTYQIYYRAAFLSTKVRYDHHHKKLNLKGRELLLQLLLLLLLVKNPIYSILILLPVNLTSPVKAFFLLSKFSKWLVATFFSLELKNYKVTQSYFPKVLITLCFFLF